MSKNIKFFSKSLADTLTDKQKRVVEQYESVSKLRAVMRWRERLVRSKVTNQSLADLLGMPAPRLSEYINFKRQPQEEKFLSIESAIYKLGC